jgi:hypothetical protein
MDDGGTANGGDDTSPTQSFDIDITAVNDEPSFTKGADQAVLNTAGSQSVAGWATALSKGPADESGQTLTFNITGNTNPGLFSAAPAVDGTSGDLTYTPNAATTGGTATITLEVMDNGGTADGGDDTSPSQTFDIAVQVVPTAAADPSYVTPPATLLTVTDGPADLLANDTLGSPAATLTSFGGGSLAGTVTDNSAGATISPLPGEADGSITVNADGSFAFTPATVFVGAFTFDYRITNGAGTSDATVTVTVDAPPAVSSTTPVDTATGVAASADLSITFSESVTVTGDWVEIVCSSSGTYNPTGSGGATLIAVTDADPTFTLDPASDFSGVETCTVTVEDVGVADDDTDDPPDNMAADHVFGFTTAPAAIDDTYASIGNVGIAPNAAGGVILGAGADEGTGLSVSEVQGTGPCPCTETTSGSGSVTVATDGSFTYTPAAGFNGADTFTYKVTSGAGTSNAATVTITVADVIWFIDNTGGGSGGTGTLADPFKTIANFNGSALDQAGDNVYLAETGTGYATGIAGALVGQTFVGEGATGANLQTVLGITFPPFSNALPAVGGTRPIITTSTTNAFNLAGNNTIRGIDIGDTGTGTGMSGAAVGALTVSDVAISGTGGGVDISGGALIDVTLDSVASSGSAADGIRVASTAGPSTFTVTGTVDVDSPTGDGIDIDGSPGVAFSFGSIDIDGGSANGIDIDSGAGFTVTGATAIDGVSGDGIHVTSGGAPDSYDFGATTVGVTNSPGSDGIDISSSSGATFTFDSLSVTTGAGAGLVANTAGTVNIGGAGNTISATGGAAFDVTSTTLDDGFGGGGVTFSSLSSTASSGRGVNLDSITGDVTVTGDTTIMNPTTQGIRVNNTAAGVDIRFGDPAGNGTLSITKATPTSNGIDLANVAGSFTVTSDGGGITFSGINDVHNIRADNVADLAIEGTDPGLAGARFVLTGGGTGGGSSGLGPANSGFHGAAITNSGDVDLWYFEINEHGGNNSPGVDSGIFIVDPDAGATLNVDNSFFNDIDEDAIVVEKTNAGAFNLNIRSSTFSGDITNFQGENMIHLDDWTAGHIIALIDGNTFDDIDTAAIVVRPAGTSGTGTKNSITISDNVITNSDNNGIIVETSDSAITDVTITGNTLTGDVTPGTVGDDEAIDVAVVGSSTSGTLNVTIGGPLPGDRNTITKWDDDGIRVSTFGVTLAGTINITIENNLIDDLDTGGGSNDIGILLEVDDSSTINARVVDNDIGAGTAGFEWDPRTSAASTTSVFLSGNESPLFHFDLQDLLTTTYELGVTAPNPEIGNTLTSPSTTLATLLDAEGNTAVGGGAATYTFDAGIDFLVIAEVTIPGGP